MEPGIEQINCRFIGAMFVFMQSLCARIKKTVFSHPKGALWQIMDFMFWSQDVTLVEIV